MSPPFRPSLVEQQFSAALDRLDDKHESADYWVAFSGGLDSTVLLHLLVNRRPAWLQGTIRAIHVDHSIHPESVHWAAHCGEVAAGYGVPLVTRKVVPGVLRRANLEASARRERYRLIAEEMAPDDLLVTAHHLNDQSETLLLQLFRGGGIRGTAGMGDYSRHHGFALFRPLLEIDRDALERYARSHQLSWIEDPSNELCEQDRNYLRNQLLPPLRHRWRGLDLTLARASRLQAEASGLLDELAQQDLIQVSDENGSALCCSALHRLSAHRQRNLLRFWLRENNYPVPTENQLLQLQRSMIHSRADRTPAFQWAGWVIYRYDDLLTVEPQSDETDGQWPDQWDLRAPLKLPGSAGVLLARSCRQGERLVWQTGEVLKISYRHGGEVIKLHGHHQKLKKLMQQWRVPPHQRRRIPLLTVADQIVAVPGHAVADGYRADGMQQGWCLSIGALDGESDVEGAEKI